MKRQQTLGIPNTDSVQLEHCRQLQTRAAHNGHRFLVLWAGGREWSLRNIQLALADNDRVVMLASDPGSDSGPSPKSGSELLGQEFAAAGIDAWTHSNVNDVLALAGTLRAGGLLHIACPALAGWPQQFVAAQQERGLQTERALFLQRFLRLAETSPAVFLMEQGKKICVPLPLPKTTRWRQELPSTDQCRLIDAIKRVVTGRAKRPLVLTADRGRGKTAALGIAAAQLLKEKKAKRILLVATSFASVATAFQHFSQQLAVAEEREQCLRCDLGELQFMPPDRALTTPPEQWDLILIDEAAKLPVGILRRLTETFPRVVFSTTVQGYEGSGRGFIIRFGEILKNLRPQSRRASLRTPVRWAEDDPLEHFLNTVFVLDQAPEYSVVASPPVYYRQLSKLALLDDEALLTQIFALLVQAHYQTSPADLQFLLDSPVKLIVACQGTELIGVCECIPEGLKDKQLIKAVVKGQRRPPGSLAAQRLSQYFGDARYLAEPSWRIHRIAVAQDYRRNAVGSGLVAAVLAAARERDISYISSSFALDPGVLNFWQQAGFTPVYLGSRRDSSSGSYSLIVVQGLTVINRERDGQAAKQLAMDLAASLPVSHPDMDAQSIWALSKCLPRYRAETYDLQRVARYVANELVFEQCAASLKRVVCSSTFFVVDNCGALPLIECVIFARSRSAVAKRYGFAGKADLEQDFKRFLTDVVADEIQE